MPISSKTHEEAAEQISRSGYTWSKEFGLPTEPITFGFRATAPTHENSHGVKESFSVFTADQIAATNLALDLWSDISNIEFVRISDPVGEYTDSATILFSNYYSATDGIAAYSNYPSAYLSQPEYASGDVWINTYMQTPSENFNFMVLLHEIGHALGLEHPGDYHSGPSIVTEYSRDAEYIEDSKEYTLMSYFSSNNTGADHGLMQPETPLMHDILALQRIYGVNEATRADDTIYGFNSNADRDVFHFDHSDDSGVFSIWDGGGTDTLDMSGYGQNQHLDLRSGTFSSTGGLKDNVSIAPGAVIENAVGGSGRDTIVGNEASNEVRAGRGRDTILGGEGDDNLVGGRGGDLVYGDADNDIILGRRGRDELHGGDGNDRLEGNLGRDLLLGGTGADALTGGRGRDILHGDAGDDTLAGSVGKDRLHGGSGNDILMGGRHKDFLWGGEGTDTFDFNSIKHSGRGAKADKILDFEVGADLLDLSGIDAKSGGSTNQAFRWIGESDFHETKGELRYFSRRDNAVVEGDTNGDGHADFQIVLKNVKALDTDDFIL